MIASDLKRPDAPVDSVYVGQKSSLRRKHKKKSKEGETSPETEQLLAEASKALADSEEAAEVKAKPVEAKCPSCPKCPAESPLVELSKEGGKDFNVDTDTDMPERLSFKLLPNNYRDSLNSLEVIDHEKIQGYSIYNNILTQTRTDSVEDRESDYYNVTVNFVVKRLPNYDAEQKHKDYLALSSNNKGIKQATSVNQSLDAGF